MIADQFKSCTNPLCLRRVSVGVLYCCPACDQAHEGRYEIHESGPLAHSESCNLRYNERSKPKATRLPTRPAVPLTLGTKAGISRTPPGVGPA